MSEEEKTINEIFELENQIDESRLREEALVLPDPAQLEAEIRRRISLHEQLQELRRKYFEKGVHTRKKRRDRLDIEISIQFGSNCHTTEFVDRSRQEAIILLQEFKEIL